MGSPLCTGGDQGLGWRGEQEEVSLSEVDMGCVYQRGKIWWIKFQDANGEPQYGGPTGATKAEARKLLHEKEVQVGRQELGLAPLTLNPEGWTLAQLMRWWLDTYSVHMPAHKRNVGSVTCHVTDSPLADRLIDRLAKGDIESLLQSKQGALAPQTINHIREFIVRAFNKASEADKWFGDNPAELVSRGRSPTRTTTSSLRKRSCRSSRRSLLRSGQSSQGRSSPDFARASCAACSRQTSIFRGAGSQSAVRTAGHGPRAARSASSASRRSSSPSSSTPWRPCRARGSSRTARAGCVPPTGSPRS